MELMGPCDQCPIAQSVLDTRAQRTFLLICIYHKTSSTYLITAIIACVHNVKNRRKVNLKKCVLLKRTAFIATKNRSKTRKVTVLFAGRSVTL